MSNDLISRSALRKAVNGFFDNSFKGIVSSDLIKYAEAVDDFIDNAPTIERILCRSRDWSNECTHSSSFEQGYTQGYEEGKNDRPKGKWIRSYDDFYVCSLCGRGICTDWETEPYKQYPFCHCGARMESDV